MKRTKMKTKLKRLLLALFLPMILTLIIFNIHCEPGYDYTFIADNLTDSGIKIKYRKAATVQFMHDLQWDSCTIAKNSQSILIKESGIGWCRHVLDSIDLLFDSLVIFRNDSLIKFFPKVNVLPWKACGNSQYNREDEGCGEYRIEITDSVLAPNNE
jgi:hypothetical protein